MGFQPHTFLLACEDRAFPHPRDWCPQYKILICIGALATSGDNRIHIRDSEAHQPRQMHRDYQKRQNISIQTPDGRRNDHEEFEQTEYRCELFIRNRKACNRRQCHNDHDHRAHDARLHRRLSDDQAADNPDRIAKRSRQTDPRFAQKLKQKLHQ